MLTGNVPIFGLILRISLYCLKLSDDYVISSVTFWIVADFDKPSGRRLLFNALNHMVSIWTLSTKINVL